jgi:hypothetical protein
MKEILQETNREILIKTIEENLDNFYIQSAMHQNFNSHLSDKINWVYSKYGDWPSCIFRVNFKSNFVETEIEEIKKLINKKKIPNGWTIGPLTNPSTLGQHLEKFGFSNVYHQSGMTVNLGNIINTPMINDELMVELVKDVDGLKDWDNVVSKIFNINIDFEFLRFLLDDNKTQFFLGIYQKKIVSALILYLSAGVAGLHAVSTLSEYRGKGFGYTISRVALIYAHELDYKIGVLQASDLGEVVYRKLGFTKYCDIYSYELEDE